MTNTLGVEMHGWCGDAWLLLITNDLVYSTLIVSRTNFNPIMTMGARMWMSGECIQTYSNSKGGGGNGGGGGKVMAMGSI